MRILAAPDKFRGTATASEAAAAIALAGRSVGARTRQVPMSDGGEGFTEAADNLVEAVPMPEALREAIERFVAERHVEREFVKRKRRRADPEALARRDQEGDRNE